MLNNVIYANNLDKTNVQNKKKLCCDLIKTNDNKCKYQNIKI